MIAACYTAGMRIAIISDIHANQPALEAVMVDAGDVDEYWCLGDMVGYGPNPNECIDMLRRTKHVCIAGNHDWAAIGRVSTADFNADASAAIDWTVARLTEDSRRYLENLPLTIENHDITLAHGSPRDPIWEYIIYPNTAQANLGHFATPSCFVGHTHLPVVFSCHAPAGPCTNVDPACDEPFPLDDGRKVINPGSVGQPRDGIRDASYMILDLDVRTGQYRRVPYDVEETQRRMQVANLPSRLWMRLSYGW